MEAYHSNQASQSMPHFSGHYRKRGSGFGILAAGIGRVALPLARKFLWPAAKKISGSGGTGVSRSSNQKKVS